MQHGANMYYYIIVCKCSCVCRYFHIYKKRWQKWQIIEGLRIYKRKILFLWFWKIWFHKTRWDYNSRLNNRLRIRMNIGCWHIQNLFICHGNASWTKWINHVMIYVWGLNIKTTECGFLFWYKCCSPWGWIDWIFSKRFPMSALRGRFNGKSMNFSSNGDDIKWVNCVSVISVKIDLCESARPYFQ